MFFMLSNFIIIGASSQLRISPYLMSSSMCYDLTVSNVFCIVFANILTRKRKCALGYRDFFILIEAKCRQIWYQNVQKCIDYTMSYF